MFEQAFSRGALWARPTLRNDRCRSRARHIHSDVLAEAYDVGLVFTHYRIKRLELNGCDISENIILSASQRSKTTMDTLRWWLLYVCKALGSVHFIIR